MRQCGARRIIVRHGVVVDIAIRVDVARVSCIGRIRRTEPPIRGRPGTFQPDPLYRYVQDIIRTYQSVLSFRSFLSFIESIGIAVHPRASHIADVRYQFGNIAVMLHRNRAIARR